jgi:D-alanyl-D-alanine carboxypeptidase
MRLACLLTVCLVILPRSALADPKLDALVAAYPDQLASYDETDLIWKDGSRTPIGSKARKTFAEMLDDADVRDQFAIPYPLTLPASKPAVDEDPGRIRNDAFFVKMYGDCRKGEVEGRLQAVAWLPGHAGGTVHATAINGVADQLQKVSRDLDTLPAALVPYLVPTSGIYNCRAISGTDRLSMHAFAAAIDINADFGDYWLWSKTPDAIDWRNRIPEKIVEIFERHGFIWGGRWYHFDTLHFEYRPELIALAKQGWPQK